MKISKSINFNSGSNRRIGNVINHYSNIQLSDPMSYVKRIKT